MIESAEEFIQLRTSEHPEEYKRAIIEQATEEVWTDVLEAHPNMAFWVIQNKTVPLSILYLLACHEDAKIREAVARKRKLDEALFDMLSKDKDPFVRKAIAQNKKTPVAILKRLTHDQDRLVSAQAFQALEKT